MAQGLELVRDMPRQEGAPLGERREGLGTAAGAGWAHPLAGGMLGLQGAEKV